MPLRKSHPLRWAAAGLLIAPLTGPFALADEIGAVGAATPLITGEPPARDARPLETGVRVIRDERIETSASGVGQIMFDDQTTLTIAPNSVVILDKYVYDPSTDTGEISLTVAKGALRFIGGRISKKTDAVITTPTGTLGVRGGAGVIEVDPDLGVRVSNIGSSYIVARSGAAETFLSRTGGVLRMPRSGQVLYDGEATSAEMAERFALFQGDPAATERFSTLIVTTENGLPAFRDPGAIRRVAVTTLGEDNETGARDPNAVRDVGALISAIEEAAEPEISQIAPERPAPRDRPRSGGGDDGDIGVEIPPSEVTPDERRRVVRHVAVQNLLIDRLDYKFTDARQLMIDNDLWAEPDEVVRVFRSPGLDRDRVLRRIYARLLDRYEFSPDLEPTPEVLDALAERVRHDPPRIVRRVARAIAVDQLRNSPEVRRHAVRRLAERLSAREEREITPAELRERWPTLSRETRRKLKRSLVRDTARQIVEREIAPRGLDAE